MLRLARAAAFAAAASILLAACGDRSCPFRFIARRTFEGTVTTFATHDIVVSRHTDLEVDLASALFNGQAARADAWLTSADCAQLFDTPYPSQSGAAPAPRCQVFLGPVTAGNVSERKTLEPGAYRVFAQAHTSNTAAARYAVDIGVWGRDCSPFAPFPP